MLAAADSVASELAPASLHASFLKRGDPTQAVQLDVEQIQDGRTSSTRLVSVRQGDAMLLTASVRFVRTVPGDDWSEATVPEVDLHLGDPSAAAVASLPVLADFEIRAAASVPAGRRIIHPYWARCLRPLPDDPVAHAAVMAFLSDIGTSGSARRPGLAVRDRLGPVTLNHSIWWHRPLKADEWMLITARSLIESGGRATARGEISAADGTLAASFAQEALLSRNNSHGHGDSSPA